MKKIFDVYIMNIGFAIVLPLLSAYLIGAQPIFFLILILVYPFFEFLYDRRKYSQTALPWIKIAEAIVFSYAFDYILLLSTSYVMVLAINLFEKDSLVSIGISLLSGFAYLYIMSIFEDKIDRRIYGSK